MDLKIKRAYHSSRNFYDAVLTQGNLFTRLYIRLFWSGTDDNEIARKILSWIPDDYSGRILDVPVGTAVFTEEKWKKLNNAQIVCLDYSCDMLDQAEARLGNCPHVSLVQGDVGKLPMESESFDLLLSMNGFHAFPQKKDAFDETWRVLKPGGEFIGCFYIRGKSRITDMLVRQILSRKGWFTPPFFTEEQLREILKRYYKDIELHIDGSIVYFRCIK